ncbi:MAG: ABC transporter substrate-binding protein [Phycisphaerae bacterium]|nr:ABC transporter substrate-binding protein [Phycisphaerae bacterium]
MNIRLAHSPDADDAFMFYALAANKIDAGPYRFEHVLADIQTLNDCAARGKYELTALSVHAYAYVRDAYALTRCGGSFGDGYGPILVAREPMSAEQLADTTVAVPGPTTSAALALKLFCPTVRTRVMPFDTILEAVRTGEASCGLIIHEGQVTYARQGLCLVANLGVWWRGRTGLPLPLGVNTVRRDLPTADRARLADILRQSIQYGLSHREEALSYAMRYARDVDAAAADRFVGMYVNDTTLDMGDRGRRAIEEFLRQGHQAGDIPDALPVEFCVNVW